MGIEVRVLIIDAFNLLYAAQAASPGLGRLSVVDLAGIIAACPPPHGVSGTGSNGLVEAVMVVDGTGGGLQRRMGDSGEPTPKSRGVRVRLRFAGAGREADDEIERMLLKLADRGAANGAGSARGCLVVSSDKRVQAAAKGFRARWIPSEVFLGLLSGSLDRSGLDATGTGQPDRPAFATEVPLGRESTRWWMRFLEVDETMTATAAAEIEAEQHRSSKQPPIFLSPPVKGRAKSESASSEPVKPTARARDLAKPKVARPAAAVSDDHVLVDPVLREAIRVWGDRIRPDDLEMSKWLNDEAHGSGRLA